MSGRQRREKPLRRVYPSGKVVYVARARDASGHGHYRGTFARKGPCGERGRSDCCAQHAIDAAYEEWSRFPTTRDTVGAYAADWTTRYPRSERTNRTNEHRISRVLDVAIEGRPLRDCPLAEFRRRHALALIDVLLRDQGRATTGATNILRALSAMAEDAITDEIIGVNPFKGLRVRSSDPRAVKQRREFQVWTFAETHAFAAAAGAYEPMIRMLADCGLRLGELLALRRDWQDPKAGIFSVTGSAWNGHAVASSGTKRHARSGPIPPGCLELLRAMPVRIDSEWLFPTPGSRRTGKVGRDLPGGLLWRHENWRRQVWTPAQEASGMKPTPQEFRHSWVTNLTAAGINADDLADMAGHSVDVAAERYRHALKRSFDQVRSAIG